MAKTLKRQRKERARQVLIDNGLQVIRHHRPSYEVDVLLQLALNTICKLRGIKIQTAWDSLDQQLRDSVLRGRIGKQVKK